MRRFIRLNVVHHRVHIHDHDLIIVFHHGHEWKKPAIPRFDRGSLKLEGLTRFHIRQATRPRSLSPACSSTENSCKTLHPVPVEILPQ